MELIRRALLEYLLGGQDMRIFLLVACASVGAALRVPAPFARPTRRGVFHAVTLGATTVLPLGAANAFGP